MKIAFFGTRGVPAKYGGFETCAEELGSRLVEHGHEVIVYCRSSYYEEKPRDYRGIKLFYLPELKIRSLETLSHTFLSLVHGLREDCDALLIFNCANSPLLPLPLLFRKRIALHVDGLEWKREKWSSLGRRYYRFTEWLAARLPIVLICDSRAIQKYYRKKYQRETQLVSYGACIQHSQDRSLLRQFNLEPGEYFLQVTRFEPENNPLLSVKAFEQIKTEKKLALVGGVRYRTRYAEELLSTKDPRIVFLGFIYSRPVLRELLSNSFAYIHGNEVGGTNPALLEAMGAGCFVICRDVPFNREVLGDAGIYFAKSADDLKQKMEWALFHAGEIPELKEKGRKIVEQGYNWDSVLEDYTHLFQKMIRTRPSW